MTSMKNEQNLLEIRDLRVTFRLDKHSTFDAVKGISFDIPTHRIVALVGESGSGKSVSGDVDPGVAPAETRSSSLEQHRLRRRRPPEGHAPASAGHRGKDLRGIFQER